MGRKKEKEIKLPASRVKAVITTDSQVLYKDSQTDTLLPAVETNKDLPDADIMAYLISEGEKLNNDNGKQYCVTKKLLENFCFYQMSVDYGTEESDKLRKDRARLLGARRPTRYIAYDTDDLFELSTYFLKERSATRKMVKYFENEDNFDRAGAAVRLITTALMAMKKSNVSEWQLQADIIEMVYCTPENKGIKEEHIRESLGLKKDKYFAMKKAGITNLSKMIFGVLPNERGYLNSGEEFLNELIENNIIQNVTENQGETEKQGNLKNIVNTEDEDGIIFLEN